MDKGSYNLQTTREIEGAEIGEHRVRIPTLDRGNLDSDPPRPRIPEKLQTKYNSKSEFNATVKAGGYTIDFPLASAGKIAQPK